MRQFGDKLLSLLKWLNRRWILCVLILTCVFWIISGNILIGFFVALFIMVFFMMIQAIIQLSKHKDES